MRRICPMSKCLNWFKALKSCWNGWKNQIAWINAELRRENNRWYLMWRQRWRHLSVWQCHVFIQVGSDTKTTQTITFCLKSSGQTSNISYTIKLYHRRFVKIQSYTSKNDRWPPDNEIQWHHSVILGRQSKRSVVAFVIVTSSVSKVRHITLVALNIW